MGPITVMDSDSWTPRRSPSDSSNTSFYVDLENEVISLMSMVETLVPLKNKLLASFLYFFVPPTFLMALLFIPMSHKDTTGVEALPHVFYLALAAVPYTLYFPQLVIHLSEQKVSIVTRICYLVIITVTAFIYCFVSLKFSVPVPYATIFAPTVLAIQVFVSFHYFWSEPNNRFLFVFANMFFGILNFGIVALCLLWWVNEKLQHSQVRYAILAIFPVVEGVLVSVTSWLSQKLGIKHPYLLFFSISSMCSVFWLLFILAGASSITELVAIIGGQLVQLMVGLVKISSFMFDKFFSRYNEDITLFKIRFQCTAFANFYFQVVAHALATFSTVIALVFLKYGWNKAYYPAIARILDDTNFHRMLLPSFGVYIVLLAVILTCTVYLLSLRGGMYLRYITPLPLRLLLKYQWIVVAACCIGQTIPFLLALQPNGVDPFSHISA